MRSLILGIFLIAFTSGIGSQETDPLPWSNPWDVGMNYEYVNQAFAALTKAAADKSSPGAVGLILKDGRIVARRAIGNMQTNLIYRPADTEKLTFVPMSERMLEDAIFDLASLTKAVATTTSIMLLVEQKKMDLDAPVVQYIPTFGGRAKTKVTVRQLLTHSSGLPAWYPFWELYIDREEIFRCIDEEITLEYPPGEKRVYSDIGFIMLGRLVETVSGQRLDRFAKQYIFDPLEMKNTMYLPDLVKRLRTAPTEYDPLRNKALKGIVHDENARALGGVSGHAGLFSTVNDLAIFAQMLLNRGEWKGKRIIKEEIIKLMLTPQLNAAALSKGSRFLRFRKQLLCWWGMDEETTIGDMGGLPSKTAFGHSGFTGTMMYIDPEHKTAAVLLSNAIHPRREDAEKAKQYREFFVNISKALVGEQNVKVQPEEK